MPAPKAKPLEYNTLFSTNLNRDILQLYTEDSTCAKEISSNKHYLSSLLIRLHHFKQ